MSSKKGGTKSSGTATTTSPPVTNGGGAKPVNAWAKPLQTAGPPPGMGPANPKNVPAGVKHVHRERLLHLSLSLVGQKVVLAKTDGCVLEGTFQTFTPFAQLPADVKNKFVLGSVKVLTASKAEPSSSSQKIQDGATVVVSAKHVVQLQAKNINLDRPANGGSQSTAGDVMTDTQISNTRGGGKGKDLVAAGSAWVTPGSTNARATALAEDKKAGMTRKGFGTAATPGGLKGSIGAWDQFKANEELFNVNASFDENLYTTELDKSQLDAKKMAEAERLAREIENTASTNIHIAEERGHVVETDYDEEDRYSGVLTKEGKQRHESNEKMVAKPVPPKMNYAAAAAKADAGKKAAPPGTTKAPEPKPAGKPKESPAEEKKEKEVEKLAEKDKSAEKGKPETSEPEKPVAGEQEKPTKQTEKDEPKASDDGTTTENAEKTKSKLNANAKAFTFNPSAKSFTPSFGAGAASNYTPPHQQPQPQHLDNSGMHMHGGHHMQPPHYMHAPMGQHGMMPMMNPQFPGMRYPPQYGSIDQHMGQQNPMHQQQSQGQNAAGQPPAPNSAQSSGAPSPAPEQGNPPSTGSESDSAQQQTPAQEGDTSQQQPPQQQQQQPVPMQYNVPQPGGYYPQGGMPMPRGPTGYPPQFVGGPQQMPPGGSPYRQMYPMQAGMPPNMHMRGPGGQPYYGGPGGPMPYPPNAYHGHGMMDENDPNFRGGRGRGPGRGRGGRRGGRGRGPAGRGNYQPYGGQTNDGRSDATGSEMAPQESGTKESEPSAAEAPLAEEAGSN